jgi:hypothetical protein
MKTITTPLVIILAALLGLSSCYELQSDEELRLDIVGKWKRDACGYPYSVEEDNVTSSSPLLGYVTFYENGRLTESGYGAYCVLDSCNTDSAPIYCTCSWAINDGVLTIQSEGSTAGFGRLRIGYPILCLKEDQLVFDNVDFNGQTHKKACFLRD